MTSQNNEIKVIEYLQNKIFNSSPEELQLKSLRKLKSSSTFSLAPNGAGLQVEQLMDFVLEWHHFQKIVEKANQLGGIMYRGDDIVMNSGRLGIEVSHDCMEGFIASELLDLEDGISITRRSTYYSGILAWAGIVSLNKSEGNGSYITVNQEFRNI